MLLCSALLSDSDREREGGSWWGGRLGRSKLIIILSCFRPSSRKRPNFDNNTKVNRLILLTILRFLLLNKRDFYLQLQLANMSLHCNEWLAKMRVWLRFLLYLYPLFLSTSQNMSNYYYFFLIMEYNIPAFAQKSYSLLLQSSTQNKCSPKIIATSV